MKKLILGLGSTLAVVAPIASVISCGNKDTWDGYTEGHFSFNVTIPKSTKGYNFVSKLNNADDAELQKFITTELRTAGGTFNLANGVDAKSYKVSLDDEDIKLDLSYVADYKTKIIKSDDPNIELESTRILSVENQRVLKYKQAVADISKVSLSDLGISFDMEKLQKKFFTINNPTNIMKHLLPVYIDTILSAIENTIKNEVWKVLEPVVNNGDLSKYALAKLNTSFPGVKYQLEKGYEPKSDLTKWTTITWRATPPIPW